MVTILPDFFTLENLPCQVFQFLQISLEARLSGCLEALLRWQSSPVLVACSALHRFLLPVGCDEARFLSSCYLGMHSQPTPAPEESRSKQKDKSAQGKESF
jgi:hypothetical protein